MTTPPEGPLGPGERDPETRFADAVKQVDEAQRQAAELGARIEAVKAGRLARDRGRLVHKYGSGSTRAQRADAAARTQEVVRDTALAAAQRARIPVPPLDDEILRVQGRAVDRRQLGLADLEARLVDEQGKTVAKAATDANGYFRLEVKPRAKPGPAKAGGRRIVTPAETPESPAEGVSAPPSLTGEVVLLRGQKELVRELVRDLRPGQSQYMELVVEKP